MCTLYGAIIVCAWCVPKEMPSAGVRQATESNYFFRKGNGMSKDFIPNSDSDFLTWATSFSAYVTAHSAELPIDSQQATALGAEVSGFRTNLNSHTVAHDAAKAAREQKDEKRVTAVAAIRNIVRQFQASPDVTDVQREAMGIPVHDDLRTLAATAAMTQPYGVVDTSNRQRHLLKYRDSASSESRARPEYASGCEIWCAITAAGTPAPADEAAYRNLGVNSASPFAVQYTMAEGGKNAHYLLRWVTREGEKGPWSETLTATITG